MSRKHPINKSLPYRVQYAPYQHNRMIAWAKAFVRLPLPPWGESND